jgi:hypothetical protein
MPDLNDICGWSELVDWFGFEPDFHDAEVVRIEFRRAPHPTSISVYTWRITSEVDDAGYYVLDRHATVIFHLSGAVVAKQFQHWNHQNVLWGIRIDRELSTQGSSSRYILHLDSTFGLEAIFAADLIVIELVPGNAGAVEGIRYRSGPRPA